MREGGLLLIVFGYAASFDVDTIRTVVGGPRAEQVADRLPDQLDVVDVDPDADRTAVTDDLRNGVAVLGLVADQTPLALIDGSDLFAARALQRDAAGRDHPGGPLQPDLETPPIMVPGLIGLIMLFVVARHAATAFCGDRS